MLSTLLSNPFRQSQKMFQLIITQVTHILNCNHLLYLLWWFCARQFGHSMIHYNLRVVSFLYSWAIRQILAQDMWTHTIRHTR